jgi:hypothetical protein
MGECETLSSDIEASDRYNNENNTFPLPAQENCFAFRSFVGSEEIQQLLVEEVLQCHYRNKGIGADDNDKNLIQWDSSSKTSLKLDLGIPCGGDLSYLLPNAVAVARRAFQRASSIVAKATTKAKSLKLISNGPLSGLSLLYGIEGSMSPHYDSPTQPGQREEWLCMMSLGNSMMFRCNDDIISVHSGDVVVMDSMAVLHGVERIVPDESDPSLSLRLGLPTTQSRLGIIFWQGRIASPEAPLFIAGEDISLDGVDSLFDDGCDD